MGLQSRTRNRAPPMNLPVRISALEGSCVVISRVISRVTVVITYIMGLITPLITRG